MINLTFTVSNIATVRQIYDRIRVARADAQTGPFVALVDMVPEEVELIANQSVYSAIDPNGEVIHWYISQYYNTTNSGLVSGWSDPVLGEPGDIYYDPLYPPEISYGTADKLIIDRIRRLIGDPVGLRREYGEDAASSIHFDNKTYELDEKGWPCDVHMAGVAMNSSTDPTINGYRYLKFNEDISVTTWSGCVEYGVDIWYYTFRSSDREIMEAYDTCPPPVGLTSVTATSEAYMLQTAIELLYSELWLDATEDGAVVTDEGTRYDPNDGQETRRKMLAGLQKRLDDLSKSLILGGVTGVLVD